MESTWVIAVGTNERSRCWIRFLRDRRRVSRGRVGFRSFPVERARTGRRARRANGFTDNLVGPNDVCPTITSGGKFICKQAPRWFNNSEYCSCGSYPQDYNFIGFDNQYLIGMSVPPVMTAQIGHQIWLQWLSKIK